MSPDASVALCGAVVALQVEIGAKPARLAARLPFALRDNPGRARSATPRPLGACPELDCVRSFVPFVAIDAAERRADALGIGAERVLIASGAISEEIYVRALARHLNVAFTTLDDVSRAACPQFDSDLLQAPAAGVLRLSQEIETLVIVPTLRAARLLAVLGRNNPYMRHIQLTKSDRLQSYVTRHAGRALGRIAAYDLKQRHPDLSAAHPLVRMPAMPLAGILLFGALLCIFPAAVFATICILLGVIFGAWTAMRLAALAVSGDAEPVEHAIPDRELPDYTIIVPLFRESRVVRRLIAALNALDYPREKLDIKLAVERDDIATRHLIATLDLDSAYQVIVAPPLGPRTKPKALNAALQFARGRYVAIFDAEDEPESDQLRRALARFRNGDPKLACVQARLTIDNTADSWLTRLFTAEYCGLFDVLLPALARWRLPLPLGGTSNHFRTEILRRVGAWDPYNVTEDADLGMRLARLGYETSVIASTTHEEGLSRLGPWIKQRSRWFKGWLQTWFVHMRSPLKLFRELGFKGFVTFQLIVGGTVLSALVHPIVIALMIFGAATGDLFNWHGSIAGTVAAVVCAMIFVSGYVASVALAIAGLARRGLLAHVRAQIMTPVLWVLLSIAAWRAVVELIRAPYRWDKTEHGLARTSRQRANV
jgi:cellulose synthase/poly-beta-1,6-N-acetylglucosamine synthase-like glycosyltransferase